MDPTQSFSKCPKPQKFAKWLHVDLPSGQHHLNDKALHGMIFLDCSHHEKDLWCGETLTSHIDSDDNMLGVPWTTEGWLHGLIQVQGPRF